MIKELLPALLPLALSACATLGGGRAAPAPPPAGPPPARPARVYSRAEIAPLMDSLVSQPAFRTANWGILVVNPRTSDTLYSHNAAKLFVPASNTKLVTGAASLLSLGPDYRWKTTVAARGEIRDGVVGGDLVVFGRGDPTVSNRIQSDAMAPLRRIADSLAAKGIKRIAGRVIQGGNAFPDSRWGAGWQLDYLDAGYAAGVDALFFNEGTVRIVVRGADSAGRLATAATAPARTYPVVRVEALTQPAADGAGNRSRITVDLDSLTGEVHVRGFIYPGDSVVQTLTLRDPASAYLFALREALAERGILVDSLVEPGARVSDSAVVQNLFTMESAPLREILPEMMKPSQNQLAEIFLKTIGLETTGVGSADSGLRTIRRHMQEWGVASDGHALRDGSGLTRNNFISPESVVRILSAMNQHALFQVFFDALPIAGVDGTLRSRMSGTPAAGNVRGKTGTLARASALSGYVTTLDGEQLIFSTFCNNFTSSANAVTGMQNEIGITLASLEWKR
jgi:D-alanyl-D-alanine carboxypeptidase/D-alanyl-D-alanine-endopeptidase (penicillin-binding protein 4)